MKITPWLVRAFVLLTAATTGTRAMAQLQERFNWPQHTNSPTVRIIAPTEGDAFLPGDEIQICADVDGFTNHIADVEFFASGAILGSVTNGVWGSDTYCLSVTNLTVGDYQLSVVATDTGGITVTSTVVDISVVTNLPPKIHIVKPDDGELILSPTNVQVAAAAFDPDGTVTSVEFFADTNSIGTVAAPPVVYVTNRWGVFPIKEPFSITWSNASLGIHVLTAVATDNDGATATSAPVSITIVTDLPPCVHIESPEHNSSYVAPATIRIRADARDADGSVTSVQFFAGSNSLGTVTSPVTVTNRTRVCSDYTLTWSNAPAGNYVLTAIATDNAGLTSTSAPVKVTVCPPPTPNVVIIKPKDGSTIYGAPRNIKIASMESGFTNHIVKVQFYAGTNAIGVSGTSPYSSIVWKNVAPGSYTLTAIAADKLSITATSTPVTITVITNRPPSWWPDN